MNAHTPDLKGEGLRIAIVWSRFNEEIVRQLLTACDKQLVELGVAADDIYVMSVPGALEIPLAAARFASSGRHAAVIALGCVVRGDTRHFEHVADGCAEGLARIALDFGVPVLNGVLAVDRHADAEARAGGAHGNKGADVALAALEMADLMVQWRDD